jgi:hypothetical protein
MRDDCRDDSDRTLDRADAMILTYDVSDDALERASDVGARAFPFSLAQPGLYTCAVGCC